MFNIPETILSKFQAILTAIDYGLFIEDLQRELMKERKAYQIMHNDFELRSLKVENKSRT